MITKITPYNKNGIDRSIPSPSMTIFGYKGPLSSDAFVKNSQLKLKSFDVALSELLNVISSSDFKDAEKRILNPDKLGILENLTLVAQRINDGRIKIGVKYFNSDAEGEISVVSGTNEEIQQKIKEPDFEQKLNDKLRYFSKKIKHLND